MAILDEHYKAVGMEKLWTYREELDLRTMKWYHRDIGKRVVTHNALDDAEALLLYLQN